MLQDIRERAQGWIAWFIVILISVPFALWGIQEYLGVGSEPVMATVNGQEITERDFDNSYRQYRQRLRQQLGENYRPELFEESVLRKQVLDSMIDNLLITQAALDMGLGASDELVRNTIRNIPSFQVAGSFNSQAYEASVRTRGLSTAGFEVQLRQSLITEQLTNVVSDSEIATEAEIKELVRLRLQRRDLDYLLLPASDYLDQIALTDDEVRSYYEENQQRFMAPERVKVEYIDLAIDNIASTLSADDATLLGYYDQHKSEFVAAPQRRASHILITVDEGADEAAVESARAKALAALERVRAGEPFADVAKELSEDPGSADQGGDLGYFEKGVMDPAFEEAAFSLQQDQVSEPVRSSFGFHVIKLTGIREQQAKPFEEMKAELSKAYLKGEAERLFYEYAERLSDLAYEDPNSLLPAADALGLQVQTSDWITRQGAKEGIFASTKVVGAAFSDDVLLEGNNSEAIEIDPEHIAVVRVIQHEEQAVSPFDEVREQIEDQLKLRKASEQAAAQGEKLLAQLQQGGSLDDVAAASGKSWVRAEKVDRDNRELPAGLLRELFSMPRPGAGEVRYGEAKTATGDFVLIALSKVTDGTLEDAEGLGGKAAITQALSRSRGEAYYRHLLANLRASASIEIIKQQP